MSCEVFWLHINFKHTLRVQTQQKLTMLQETIILFLNGNNYCKCKYYCVNKKNYLDVHLSNFFLILFAIQ